jgi:quercetin dioxygenase-like cupin family protein
MNSRIVAVGLVTFGLSLGTAIAQPPAAPAKAAPAARKAAAKKAVVWPADDLKWQDVATIPGAQIAVLKGDPTKGAYEALKKLPAGADMGWHTHTFGQEVMVVSGIIDFTVEGETAPKALGPGSWAVIPGGLKHSSVCRAGADCIYFEDQAGRSDFKKAEK